MKTMRIMKGKMLIALLLVHAILISCNSFDEKQALTAESVVQNYLDAIGGYENLKSIKSYIRTGYHFEPKYNLLFKAEVIHQRPNLRVISGDMSEGFADFKEGYNGEVAWEHFEGDDVVFSDGAAEDAILKGAEFDLPFIDAELKGHSIKLNGMTVLNDQEVIDIEVVIGEDFVTNFYFDPKTNLLVARRKVMPIHAKGDDVEILVFISEYRKVAGVLVPFSFIERYENTGDMFNATIFNSIVANQEISQDVFDPPVLSD